jgi:hypothetical protein
LPYWSESNAAKFLGAVSDDGRTFFWEVNSRFTSDVTVHFPQALQNEFGDRLHVVLDNAVYFASNKVAEFVDNSKLEVTSLPTGSPDMNPVEEAGDSSSGNSATASSSRSTSCVQMHSTHWTRLRRQTYSITFVLEYRSALRSS